MAEPEYGIDARTRFMNALRARENFITIPIRGSRILHFTRSYGKRDEIVVHVEVDSRFRGKNKMSVIERRPKTVVKIRHQRVNIGKLPDVVNGAIAYMTPDDFLLTLPGILAFTNLYLDTDIREGEIDKSTLNLKQNPIKLKIKETSLRYQGELSVHLV